LHALGNSIGLFYFNGTRFTIDENVGAACILTAILGIFFVIYMIGAHVKKVIVQDRNSEPEYLTSGRRASST